MRYNEKYDNYLCNSAEHKMFSQKLQPNQAMLVGNSLIERIVGTSDKGQFDITKITEISQKAIDLFNAIK